MTPVEEARVLVKSTLKEVIRVETLLRLSKQGVPLYEMDEESMQVCEEKLETMVLALEAIFERAITGETCSYQQAHIYYSLYTSLLTSYMLGFNCVF